MKVLRGALFFVYIFLFYVMYLCIEMCRMPVQFDHVKGYPIPCKHYCVQGSRLFGLFDMVVSRKRLLRKGLIELDVVEIVFISDVT